MNIKLEVGKKYVTRNGDVVECVAVWTKPDDEGYQATVLDANEYAVNYLPSGQYSIGTTMHDDDIVAEHKEPRRVWVKEVPSDGGTIKVLVSASPEDDLGWVEFVEVVKEKE